MKGTSMGIRLGLRGLARGIAPAVLLMMSTASAADPAPAGAARPAKVRPPTPLEYPEAEKKAGHHGNTTVEITVGADGASSGARVVTSSGFPALDEAALKAVSSWRFDPALDAAGLPVASTFPMRIAFKLESGAGDTEGVQADRFLKDPCSKVTAEAAAFRQKHPDQPIKDMYRFKLMTGLILFGGNRPVEQMMGMIKLMPAIHDDVLVRCEKTPDAIYENVMADAMKAATAK